MDGTEARIRNFPLHFVIPWPNFASDTKLRKEDKANTKELSKYIQNDLETFSFKGDK